MAITERNETMLAIIALLLVGAVGTMLFMVLYHVMFSAF